MNRRPGAAAAVRSAAPGMWRAWRGGGATLGRRPSAAQRPRPGAAERCDEVAHAREAHLRRWGERALERAANVRGDARGCVGETGLHHGGERVLVRLGAAAALGELLRRAVLRPAC